MEFSVRIPGFTFVELASLAMKRRPLRPHALTSAVQKITAPLFKGPQILWAQLRLHWVTLVGTHWASQTHPERLVVATAKKPRGTLYLCVWGGRALELTYEAPFIIEKVNQYFGFAAIHEIKWRVSRTPLVSPSPEVMPRSLSCHEKEWVRETVGFCHSELEDALVSLGESLLQHTS